MRVGSMVLGALLLFTTAACHSSQVKLPTAAVGPSEKALGHTEGSSVGIMLFGCIPINQNSRFENAYLEAVQNGGGKRLADVVISEQWFWAWVLNGYIFKVEGTAVTNN